MQIKTEKTERGMVKRGPGGRFAKGTAPGPGRPRSTLDFRKTIEQQAFLDDDYDLEAALYRVFKKQIERAEGGNLEAARFVTERLAGVLELPERVPKVAVQVNAGRYGGPPVLPPLEPDGSGFPTIGEHLAKFNEIAARRGLTPLGVNSSPPAVEDGAPGFEVTVVEPDTSGDDATD